MLNDAFRTLRDPVARAEYVLRARIGIDASPSNVPPELLEEVFELNMALDELRDGRRIGAARSSWRPRERFSRHARRDRPRAIECCSRRYDAAHDDAVLEQIRSVLEPPRST